MTEEDEKVLRLTIENLLRSNKNLDENMGKLIGVIGSMQERISALESARAAKPVLLNGAGMRIN